MKLGVILTKTGIVNDLSKIAVNREYKFLEIPSKNSGFDGKDINIKEIKSISKNVLYIKDHNDLISNGRAFKIIINDKVVYNKKKEIFDKLLEYFVHSDEIDISKLNLDIDINLSEYEFLNNIQGVCIVLNHKTRDINYIICK